MWAKSPLEQGTKPQKRFNEGDTWCGLTCMTNKLFNLIQISNYSCRLEVLVCEEREKPEY